MQNSRNFHPWDFRKILGIIAKSREFLSRDFRKIPGIFILGIRDFLPSRYPGPFHPWDRDFSH